MINLKPTGRLRWKWIGVIEQLLGRPHVLQQEFLDEDGKVEWIDVPTQEPPKEESESA